MRLIVFTATIGRPEHPLYIGGSTKYPVEFIRFTKDLLPDWPPARATRWPKIMPHKNFVTDYSIWIDSNISLMLDPWKIVEYLGENDIAFFSHHWGHDCIYQEVENIITFHKDDPQRVRAQADRYRKEGYPAHNGLIWGKVIVRRHTPTVAKLNQAWWDEIVRDSHRDQLSFNYVSWKLGIPYSTITAKSSDVFFWWVGEHIGYKKRLIKPPIEFMKEV